MNATLINIKRRVSRYEKQMIVTSKIDFVVVQKDHDAQYPSRWNSAQTSGDEFSGSQLPPSAPLYMLRAVSTKT